ncbi:hypothetical protein F1880_004799 [Penicillium rolfsii]|nr:hypothetical protein F1880_004799 [Penicillium rolfsii]
MDIRATRKLNGQPSRARIACLHCRSRKVRCTLAIKGPPCTNCQLDGLECVTCPKLRKRSIHTSLAEDDIPSRPIQEEKATQSYDICTARNVQDDSLKFCDLNGMNIFKRQRTASGGHEGRLVEGALSVDSCLDRSMPTRDVFYSYYSFLRAPNLGCLQSADRSFLEAQESLHVPTGPILEAVMSRYFLYVHPCLPVINEAEFWPMLYQEASVKSSFSLLVFQAMIFAACSYISLADARKWGAESILEMRNSFYRRAKFLYNFGVEDDRLCIAQALTLLTYQSTGTDHLSNTTWLGLAIQQAQLINAHLYYRYPVQARYNRSDLKRLWWCLIIRDRIVSLGMRRPLQILPTHFDVASRDPLMMDDLSDEIHTSRVYDSETKGMLCKIMTSLCRLAVSLTNVIMTLYPLDPFPDGQGGGGQSAEIASIDDIQSRLQYWATTHMLRPSPEDSNCHPSVAFFKQLTALYFESARLALYQYISFRIHRNQRPDDWPDLMDAVTAIHDVVKRFVVDGTAGHLPISAVAYTALPQMVLNLNLRLSSDTTTRRRQENVLNIYMELNRQYVLRYDVSHVSTWVNRIVRLFELSLSPIKPQLADLARRQKIFPGKDCLYLLELEPELYFKISGMMDASMSTGQLALEYSGTRLGFPSQDVSFSLSLGDFSESPAAKSHEQPRQGQILPLDENSVEEEDEDAYTMDLTSIEHLSRGLGLFGE